jgi:hypothetical protein
VRQCNARVSRLRRVGAAWLLAWYLFSTAACERQTSAVAAERDVLPGATPVTFVDAAGTTGLDFVHVNGMTGQFYYPELFGPGVALLDFDNDGDLDVFVTQGSALGATAHGSASSSGAMAGKRGGRLYRNEFVEKHTLTFTDVTEQAGLATAGYGMGAATGDFNNDGCLDLLVTALEGTQLFRNNCNGTFTDVSAASGVGVPGWTVSATFVDYDRDGWLDLFVGAYMRYSVTADEHCFGMGGDRVYCPPAAYQPRRSRLYHNQRNGTFIDVTDAALTGGDFGPTLGIVAADFNADGWPDVYVANDSQPDQLWINAGNGTFVNRALLAGTAYNADGHATASMGVDAGDFDNDGDDDILHTNLVGEGDTLLVNDATGTFADESKSRGLFLPSLRHTGFGAAWVDIDNDGWLDIFSTNGGVRTIEEGAARRKDPFPYRERKQLLLNLHNGRFGDITDRAGAPFQSVEVGRGAAFGDIDNDGDIDIVVGATNGSLQLLINQTGNRRHWIGLRLLGVDGRRDALGARVAIARTGQPTVTRRVRTDGSYGSASDARVLAGLGSSAVDPTVRVTWPDGRTDEWRDLRVDAYTTLREGTGR